MQEINASNLFELHKFDSIEIYQEVFFIPCKVVGFSFDKSRHELESMDFTPYHKGFKFNNKSPMSVGLIRVLPEFDFFYNS